MKKKVLSIGLTLCILALMMATWSVFASADTFAGGDGSLGNPYQVATPEQLSSMRSYSGYRFILTADIDLTAYCSPGGAGYNDGAGWLPFNFSGEFNGNGHTITGLYINRTGGNIGLFASNGNIIRNVVLKNPNVTGGGSVGALAGCNGRYYDEQYGRIYNCGVIGGTVHGIGGCVGGLVGYQDPYSEIYDCFAGCAVSSASSCVGGLVGYNKANITRCYAYGQVSGTGNLGGFVGANESNDDDEYWASVTNCYYNSEYCGLTVSDGRGTAKTTAQMLLQSTYSGFTFSSSAWAMTAGATYPYLATVVPNPLPAPITLTVGGSFTVSDKTYDGTANATINTNSLSLVGVLSGDTVTLSPVAAFTNASAATGKTVSLKSGTAIGGTNASKYFFSLAGAPTATAAITKKPLTVEGSFTTSDKIYDGTTAAMVVTNDLSLSGIVIGDTVTLTPIATFSSKTAGTGKTVSISPSSTLGGSSAGNYALSMTGAPTTTANITAKTLTVTGSFTSSNKTYDGSLAAAVTGNNLSLSGIVSGDTVTLSPVAAFTSTTAGTGKTVGLTASSTLGGSSAGNYTLSLTGAPTATAAITAKTLTVTGSFTASTKTYDGTLAASVATNSLTLFGIVSGDTVTLTPVAAFANTSVGTGKTVSLTATSTLGGSSAGNYTLSLTGAPTTTASITAKTLTVTGSFTTSNKTYDATTAATVATNSLTLSGIVSGDTVTLTPVAAFANTSVGTGKTVSLTASSTLGGSSAGNYTLSLTGAPTKTANITAKTLTVGGSFTASNKTYDGTTAASVAANNLTLSGIVSGDTVTLTPVAAFANTSVGTGKTVSLTASSTLGGSSASNYALSLTGAPTATAAITAKTLTVTGSFTASDKPYDGGVTASIATNNLSLTGIVSGDTVTLIPIAAYGSKTAETGKVVSLTASSTLGGSSAGNYSLSLTGAPTATAAVTVKTVTLGGSFIADNKTYDGTDTASVSTNSLTVTGKVTGDDVSVSPAAAFVDANAGIGKSVSLTAATSLTGTDAGNYALSLTGAPTTTADISKAAQSAPTAPTMENKTPTTVTLTPNSANEFRVGSGTWQDSNVFAGLAAGVTYSFTQRVKETQNYTASAESAALAVTTPLPGSGTEADPYQISTPATLNAVRTNTSAWYILKNNLDMSGYGNFSSISGFSGNINGDGYVISGLYVSASSTNDIGLFGSIVSGGTVKNLTLSNIYIYGNSRVGGLVGNLDNSTVMNCCITGSSTVKGKSDSVGGLVGSNGGTVRQSCVTASVTVTGVQTVGGFVGYAYGSTLIENCFSLAGVSSKYGQCGGFVGSIYNGTIRYCYSTGTASGGGESYGGFAGYRFEDNYFITVIMTSCYYNTRTCGWSDTGKGTPLTSWQMVISSNYSGWDFSTVWTIDAGASYPYLRGVSPTQHPVPPTLTVGGSFTVDSKAYNGSTWAVINVNNLTLISLSGGDTVVLSPVAAFTDPAVGNGKTVVLTASSAISGANADKYILSLTGAPTTTASIKSGSQATAPAVPTAQSKTESSITLTTVTGCEYRKNGGIWQDSPTFTGLTTSTAYTFTQRYKETELLAPSPESAALSASLNTLYTVSTSVTPTEGGTALGARLYKEGDTATLTASPQTGYVFAGWTLSGAPVSTDASYSFIMGTQDKTLTACFIPEKILTVKTLESTKLLMTFNAGTDLFTLLGTSRGAYGVIPSVCQNSTPVPLQNMQTLNIITGQTTLIFPESAGLGVNPIFAVIAGDCFGDGIVDGYDTDRAMDAAVNRYTFESTGAGQAQYQAGDVNNDGVVDALDAFCIELAATGHNTLE